MMQYLKLPMDSFKPTAGYKNLKYRASWGFSHYGVDCVSSAGARALYGLGDGIVAAAGLDGLNGKTTGKGSGCGFCLVVIYKDCWNYKRKKAYDVTVTYMHMSEMPKVKKGQKVTAKTLLGYYGNTGANTTGPHLHFQFDTDTKYPLYCCGLSVSGHNLLKAGTVDSTMNPCEFLFRAEGQKATVPSSAWYDSSDFNFPEIPKEEAQKPEETPAETQQKKPRKEKIANGITIVKY